MIRGFGIDSTYAAENKDISILIVEDQSTDIIGPYMLFHHLGFNVTLTFDGGQALVALHEHNFDLVILDWNMPYVSGGDFLKRLHLGNINYKSKGPIAIILYSGEMLDPEKVISSENYNIVDIWKKPMSATDMLRKIKKQF